MKTKIILIALFVAGLFVIQNVVAQTISHTWKATTTNSDWNNASNWEENSVPTASSNVKIANSNFQPVIPNSLTINYLLLDNGAGVNIQSYTLTISASLRAYYSTIVSNDGKMKTPQVFVFLGCVTQGNVYLEFDQGIMQGGNTFQNNLYLTTNSPAGLSFQIAASTPDSYMGQVNIINHGEGGIDLADGAAPGATATTFEQSFTYINDANSPNYFAENANSGTLLFKGVVSISSTNTDPNSFVRIWKSEFRQVISIDTKGSEIQFGGNITFKDNLYLSAAGGAIGFGTTNVVMLHPATIQIGSSGFSAGNVFFGGLQYQSSTAIYLLLGDANTHNTVLTSIQTTQNNSFTGPINLRADYIELNGGIYNGTVNVERTGPNRPMSMFWNGNGNNRGGNVFNATLTAVNHSGTDWRWATSVVDVFNSDVVLKHGRGSDSQLWIAQTGAHLFKGNLTLQSTPDALSSGGIQIGFGANETQLAVGKSISTLGFLGGRIKLYHWHQLGFSNPQTISMNETARLQLDYAIFESRLDVTVGHLEIANSTFFRSSSFIKTGLGSDYCNGSNEFHQRVKFDNQAPQGNRLVFVVNNSLVKE